MTPTTSSGIYQIKNLTNNKVYVGSAVNLRDRKNTHWKRLHNGTHENAHLQNSWNRYGGKNFKFEVLEKVLVKNLISTEQKWMDLKDVLNRQCGYNIAPKAGNSKGCKRTLEQIKANSVRQKGRLTGSSRYNAKLTFNQAEQIRFEYKTKNVSYKDLAKKYNISKSGIYKIIKGKAYVREGHISNPINKSKVIKNKIRRDKIKAAKRAKSNMTEQKVKKLRLLWETKTKTQRELAELFNISRSSVQNIVSYRNWNL